MTEKLWDLYESAVAEEYRLQRQEEFYLNTIERSTQSGVANGILRSIEVLEKNKRKTWERAFEVFCKVRGKDVNSGFGFWESLEDKSPFEDGTYLVTLDGAICGNDEPIIGMCGYENGKWDEEGYVIAWMPLPHVFGELEGKPNDDQS